MRSNAISASSVRSPLSRRSSACSVRCSVSSARSKTSRSRATRPRPSLPPVCPKRLITTAAGLFVAVVAVIFFNYFKSRIKGYNQEMIVAANQLAEMLHFHNTGAPIPTELYQPPAAAAR